MRLESPEKRQSFLRRFDLYKYYSQVNKLLKIPVEDCNCINLENSTQNKEDRLEVITISFNNTHVLRHQIAKIKENITDSNFTHIIADNSNLPDKRAEIESICKDEGLPYIGIPQLEKKFLLRGSKSHALSLNWVYYQVILKRKPRWFGFLDHDIYPLQPISIVDMFDNKPFYGKKEYRKEYWYLWPGFCFFELDYLSDIKVDFSPTKVKDTYLDTGGALWYSLYYKLNESDFTFPTELRISLEKLGYNYHEMVEFINDNWFHSMNASLWKGASDYSEAIDDILTRKNLSSRY